MPSFLALGIRYKDSSDVEDSMDDPMSTRLARVESYAYTHAHIHSQNQTYTHIFTHIQTDTQTDRHIHIKNSKLKM